MTLSNCSLISQNLFLMVGRVEDLLFQILLTAIERQGLKGKSKGDPVVITVEDHSRQAGLQ